MHIRQLELLTHNIEETLRFYRDILGLHLQSQSEDKVTFQAGSTTLSFVYTTLSEQPVYHFAFTIPSNKLKEAYVYMEQKVTLLDVQPKGKIADFVNWNAEAFYFYDNNGNILEYISRYDLDNKVMAPFNAQTISAISEIGLVTPNVSRFADELSQQYAIPFFPKQPRQEQFTVLGDNDGLLILVAENRPWYPTATKAKIFPLQCWIEDKTGALVKVAYPMA